MNIEIDTKTEEIIRRNIASGRFDSPGEVIASVIQQWDDSEDPERVDAKDDFDDIPADLWPKDEPPEAFDRWLEQQRQGDVFDEISRRIQ